MGISPGSCAEGEDFGCNYTNSLSGLSVSIMTVLWVSGFGSCHGCSLGTLGMRILAGTPWLLSSSELWGRASWWGGGMVLASVIAMPLLHYGWGCCYIWCLCKQGTKIFGSPTTCAHEVASVTGIKPGNLFRSLLGRELWQAFAICAASIQETEPNVWGSQAVLPAHLNPDPAAVPPLAALGLQAPPPREPWFSCTCIRVAESRAVLHSPVHLNRALLADIFCWSVWFQLCNSM